MLRMFYLCLNVCEIVICRGKPTIAVFANIMLLLFYCFQENYKKGMGDLTLSLEYVHHPPTFFGVSENSTSLTCNLVSFNLKRT
jgi:hypothetical protein